MVEYNKVNVKLSDSQLNKLKTTVKNQTGITLRTNIKIFNENNLPWIPIDNNTKNQVKKCIWKQYVNWYKVVWSSDI